MCDADADAEASQVLKKLHLKTPASYLLPRLWLPIVSTVCFYKTGMKTYSCVVNTTIQALKRKQTCSSLDL